MNFRKLGMLLVLAMLSVALLVGCGGGSTTPLPTITGFVPDRGTVAGGTSVIMTGTHFSGATAVIIGGTPAAAFTVNSDTQITAVTPAHAAGVVAITVTTPGGTADSPTDFNYFIPASAPTVTDVSPSAGPVVGGMTATITGTYFTGATAVSFGGIPAPAFTVINDWQIMTITPAGTVGTTSVTVTTPGGTSNSGTFTYAPLPTLTAIVPNSGPVAGGTSVTITGTEFTGTTAVTIGGTPAPAFTVDSATQITAVTPAHAAGGASVAVTTPGGTAIQMNGFTYLAPPG